MTLPTLIAKNQKKATLTQLKKAYSELAQAVSRAQVKYGTMDSWDLSQFDVRDIDSSSPEYNQMLKDRATYFSENYLFPYIKTIKKCTPISDECWPTKVYTLDGGVSSQASGEHTVSKASAFVTPAGYSVLYWIHSSGNGGWFFIDVNASKKPNTLGKDIFAFMMNWGNSTLKTGLYPVGLHAGQPVTRDELINDSTLDMGEGYNSISGYGCKKGAGFANSGGCCAALIMSDGWEMKEDYPWF